MPLQSSRTKSYGLHFSSYLRSSPLIYHDLLLLLFRHILTRSLRQAQASLQDPPPSSHVRLRPRVWTCTDETILLSHRLPSGSLSTNVRSLPTVRFPTRTRTMRCRLALTPRGIGRVCVPLRRIRGLSGVLSIKDCLCRGTTRIIVNRWRRRFFLVVRWIWGDRRWRIR